MMLSNNTALPPLNGLGARSTWAVLIAAAVTICNALGIDLLAVTSALGAGATPGEIIETGQDAVEAWQLVAPLFLGFWAWIERRAPNFRLTWPWSKG